MALFLYKDSTNTGVDTDHTFGVGEILLVCQTFYVLWFQKFSFHGYKLPHCNRLKFCFQNFSVAFYDEYLSTITLHYYFEMYYFNQCKLLSSQQVVSLTCDGANGVLQSRMDQFYQSTSYDMMLNVNTWSLLWLALVLSMGEAMQFYTFIIANPHVLIKLIGFGLCSSFGQVRIR